MSLTADSGPSSSAAPNRGKRWRLPRYWGFIAILVWAGAVGAGFERLSRYESTPALKTVSPAIWPGASAIPRPQGRATLVMFVHPLCPCTRASLAELREIMAQGGENVRAWVLVMRAAQSAARWERTPTLKAAQDIGGVTVLMDEDGREAARFGATTSGYTLVYGAQARLEFAGGITAARGHIGDNLGRQRVLDVLQGNAGGGAEHAVYGCALHDSPRKT